MGATGRVVTQSIERAANPASTATAPMASKVRRPRRLIDGTAAAAVARPFDVDNVPSYAKAVVSLNFEPYYLWGDTNDSIDSLYGPSSMHAGQVGHLLGDGSARFIDDTIAPALYDALVTRAGGEALDAF